MSQGDDFIREVFNFASVKKAEREPLPGEVVRCVFSGRVVYREVLQAIERMKFELKTKGRVLLLRQGLNGRPLLSIVERPKGMEEGKKRK